MKINPSECLLIFQARNEAEYIEDFLNHHDPMYDKFIAMVDRSSDKTYSVVRKHPKCAIVIEKIIGDKYDHLNDRSVLEQSCIYYNHKWVWRLDIDERVSHTFLDEMQDLPNGTVIIGMRFLSLYPDKHHFICGNHPYGKINIYSRLFKRIERNLIPRRHLAPVYIAESLVYHYHMLTEERRQRRYETYIHDNPEKFPDDKIHKCYRHIINVNNARTLPHNDSKMCSELQSFLQNLKGLDQNYQRDIIRLSGDLSERWLNR